MLFKIKALKDRNCIQLVAPTGVLLLALRRVQIRTAVYSQRPESIRKMHGLEFIDTNKCHKKSAESKISISIPNTYCRGFINQYAQYSQISISTAEFL